MCIVLSVMILLFFLKILIVEVLFHNEKNFPYMSDKLVLNFRRWITMITNSGIFWTNEHSAVIFCAKCVWYEFVLSCLCFVCFGRIVCLLRWFSFGCKVFVLGSWSTFIWDVSWVVCFMSVVCLSMCHTIFLSVCDDLCSTRNHRLLFELSETDMDNVKLDCQQISISHWCCQCW